MREQLLDWTAISSPALSLFASCRRPLGPERLRAEQADDPEQRGAA